MIKEHVALSDLTPAQHMLPNPHIQVAEHPVSLPQEVNDAHLAVINAEQRALREGFSPKDLPLYGGAILRAESANEQVSDKLTGLLNREGINMWFERHKPAKFALFFSDARNFKEINDTHGHNVGDKVIGHIGKTIASRFRISKPDEEHANRRKNPEKTDAVAGIGRWGGDEILTVVDLSDIEEGQEEEVIESMKHRLDVFGDYEDQEASITIPISIRSAAMLGYASDNKTLSDYQSKLDEQLTALKATEKAAR